MKEISVGKDRIFTAPSGATEVEIHHEWEDEVVTTLTVASGSVTFNPNSIGIYKFVWDSGGTEFYSAVVPVLSASDFFNDYPGLEDYEDDFARVERTIRFQIENYTGQKFGPLVNKTLVVQGDGGNSLKLPHRIRSISAVIDSNGEDITDYVQISPDHDEILQRSPQFRGGGYDFDIKRDIIGDYTDTFSSNKDFNITGDWGWEYMPIEVSQAASLMLDDSLGGGDAVELRKQGVIEAQLGDFSLKLNADQWGTTGNVQADQLLARFVNYGIGLV